jgi:hypothetical protein
MSHWLLPFFRVALIIGVLAWAVEAGDLSQQARGFVETHLPGWGHTIGR